MAELCCSVENCTYNNQCYCCKGDICVGGERAHKDEDTCCESFVQRREGSYTSSLEHPSRIISIDCEAGTASITRTISARRSMWTSKAAAPVIAARPPAVLFERDKNIRYTKG